MKFMLFSLAALAIFGLPGCASEPARTASVQADTSMSNVDRYRRAVAIQAERKGVEVHWINPPTEMDLDEYDDTFERTAD